jgi:general stress protein CsbA
MKKKADVICWIAVSILLLYVVVVTQLRGVGVFMAILLEFAHSPLPWWILGPAAVALVAGFTYLFKNSLHKRTAKRTIPN